MMKCHISYLCFQWVYEGVPYLNNEQERKLKTHLANANVETDGLRYDILDNPIIYMTYYISDKNLITKRCHVNFLGLMLPNDCVCLCRSNEHELQEMCSKVAHWLATAKESDTCTVPLSEGQNSTKWLPDHMIVLLKF